jgi:hypothetical protein
MIVLSDGKGKAQTLLLPDGVYVIRLDIKYPNGDICYEEGEIDCDPVDAGGFFIFVVSKSKVREDRLNQILC